MNRAVLRVRGSAKRGGGGLGAFVLAAAAAGSSVAACNHDIALDPFPIGIGPSHPVPSPRPDFGPTVSLPHAPPPVSGGTLLINRAGTTAIASDPDRDAIYVADVDKRTLLATLPLSPGDEPGRLVEDGAQRVHVALRGGGALVTVDLGGNRIIDRRAVCAAPRGLAYDPASDSVIVACNGGELVTLPAAGGAATRTLHLETDLRDVVIQGGHLFVSRFRQAELLEIDGKGSVIGQGAPRSSSAHMEPDVAWRTISVPGQGTDNGEAIAVVHQRTAPTPVRTSPGGYGESVSGCADTSIIESAVTMFQGTAREAAAAGPALSAAVLPVDIAISRDAKTFAVVSAGNSKIEGAPGVFFFARPPTNGFPSDGSGCMNGVLRTPVSGQATAVAFAPDRTAWIQTREPAQLVVMAWDIEQRTTSVAATIALSSVSREDTGHSIVHSNSGGFIACASCHAEGGDDGRTWRFAEKGGTTPARRTQSLRGTLSGTAPYHWEGDMKDIPTLAHEVFVSRMGGRPLEPDQTAALQSWLFSVPRPATSPAIDAASAARGKAIFESSETACATCHNGARLTNNLTVDVGTGGMFQVPSLVGVGWRAPYMHDGRAPQLVDRFNPGLSGASHGHTSQLTTAQIDDLVAYLQTL